MVKKANPRRIAYSVIWLCLLAVAVFCGICAIFHLGGDRLRSVCMPLAYAAMIAAIVFDFAVIQPYDRRR